MEVDVATRTLRLLTLLQVSRPWPAEALADRLGVSTRTLRRDVRRLQDLGYAVVSRPGPGGHYRLGSGATMPPVPFEDDEVVALVAGLRMAEPALPGDAAARALLKVRRVLPRRLARVADAVAEHSEALPDPSGPGTAAQPADDVLAALTAAAAADRAAGFSYVDRHGVVSGRRVDSLRCLYARGRWYLLAHDRDRDGWRVFRLDRISDVVADEPALRRDPPAEDLAAWLHGDFGRFDPTTGGPADR